MPSLTCVLYSDGHENPFSQVAPAPAGNVIPSRQGPGQGQGQPSEPQANGHLDVPDDGRASRLIEEYGTEIQVMAEVRGYFQVAYKVFYALLLT
jgi:hypothetical protein